MKEDILPMFHARRATNFSLMQWIITAVIIVTLLYGFYMIYDLRHINEMQREQIAKLTHDEEALREQMRGTAEEKNKMAKTMESESNRRDTIISTLKDEKAAIEKNCAKDKHDLDVTIKDFTEKNTECKGSLAVAIRDKTKLETEFNDLHDKFAQVNKNLEAANDKRAEDHTTCSQRIAELEAKLANAHANANAGTAQTSFATGQTSELAGSVDVNKPVALETNTGFETKATTGEVHEIKEPIVAQMAAPKDLEGGESQHNDKKAKDTMQMVPPRNMPVNNGMARDKNNDDDMQVLAPKVSEPDHQPLVGHFREADENDAREENM